MPSHACQLCGTTDGLRTFEMSCGAPGSQQLTVCRECLDLRETKRWDPGQADGERLLDALRAERHDHPQGRYAYLTDPEESVHLVRLQHGWIQDHTATA